MYSTSKDICCIYHSADNDGLCSAAIVRYCLNKDIEMVPYDHGRSLNLGDDSFSTYYIVDIMPPIDFMKKNADKIIWMDHHTTSINNPDLSKIRGIRKTGFSACELTWQYFHEDEEIHEDEVMPVAIQLLGRYDVWDKKWQNEILNLNWQNAILPFQLAVSSYKRDFEKGKIEQSDILWKALFVGDFSYILSLIEEGKTIHRYVNNNNASVIKSYYFETSFDGLKAVAFNRQPGSSQLFNSIWDNSKYDLMIAFGMFVQDGKKMWRVSLYTDKPGIDVSVIAKKYGELYKTTGGGHVQAAGFVIPGDIELPF